MKTVGIIGGLGPETTAIFYERIIELWVEMGHKNRPKIVISNVPVSFELEKKFINYSKGTNEFLALLFDSIKTLEKSGCDFIVIPCNTAHLLISELNNFSKTPILSIIDCTVQYLIKNKVNSVGILATPATINSGLYTTCMTRARIVSHLPCRQDVKKLGITIDRLIKKQHGNTEKIQLNTICSNFETKQVGSILLACTDLQIIMPKNLSIPIYDTMEILARATVSYLTELDLNSSRFK